MYFDQNMKKTTAFLSTLFLAIVLIFSACLQEEEHIPLRIAISKSGPGDHYAQYARWLKVHDSTLEVINLYALQLDSAIEVLSICDGLLLSGGPDIHPQWYGQEADTSRMGSVDLRRDTLEMAAIERALELEIPVLGICRGAQIMNVSQGGSLYQDIPTDTDSKLFHRCKDRKNCYHQVMIDSNSMLFKTTGVGMGFVNTNHHQAVDRLADNLKATAHAEDGLIEAIEWKNPEGKSLFMGVQWHPERMDHSNPLALPVGMYFLKAAESRQKTTSE